MFGRIVALLALGAVAIAVVARPSGSAGRERVLVVRPHDTLWAIAAAYYDGDPREGVWKLQERNRLGGTVIRPGQRLSVPR